MASKNMNEALDDCICNVNNETFRHLVQGGNLNTLQETQQVKQSVVLSEKSRKYSVDSLMVMRGLIKGPIPRRVSCSPSMILPGIPSTSNSQPTSAKGRRRHSHAGIPSTPNVLSFNIGETLTSKHRRRSMISLGAPSTTLGPLDLRSLCASQATLQELDEGKYSGHETPASPPLEAETLLETSNEKLGHCVEAKISVEDMQDHLTSSKSSDFGNSWSKLPKSASFISLEHDVETRREKNRSASFSLPSGSRQRKKAVSYSSESHPIFECPVVSTKDDLRESKEDSQSLQSYCEERRNSSDSSSSSSIISLFVDEQLIEDPMSQFFLHTSIHLSLLHPAQHQTCLGALMV